MRAAIIRITIIIRRAHAMRCDAMRSALTSSLRNGDNVCTQREHLSWSRVDIDNEYIDT